MAYNPNEIETEEDGFRAEALRRLKVRHLYKTFQSPTPLSSKSLKAVRRKPASPSPGKPNT